MPLLDIRNLTIEFMTPIGPVRTIDRINFTLHEGEILGIVGESGSGKSLLARVICGLTKEEWHITVDSFRLQGVELFHLPPQERRRRIGHTIAMIVQEPDTALDPSIPIETQLQTAIPYGRYKPNRWFSCAKSKKRAIELLHWVGIKAHDKVLKSYPHQLTNSEKQRVIIAAALASEPRLLVADEPINSIEAHIQAQIFRLLTRMNQLNKTSILLLSHDLSLIAQWAHSVTVMYCGQIVESGTPEQLLHHPYHPYTLALLRMMPSIQYPLPHKGRLNALPGVVPSLQCIPPGCRLGPRCPYAQKKCLTKPPLQNSKHHAFACHFPLVK